VHTARDSAHGIAPYARGRRRECRVGCSGWNYDHWRNGVFYPPRCAPCNWLRYYAKFFDTVEINMTFYRLPKAEIVARWVEESPAGFTFAVKVSRYITHVKRLQDVQVHLPLLYDRIEPLLRSPKMGPLLWQLPPTFKADLERLASALEQLHDGRRHAFEFRHPSWFSDLTFETLRKHSAAICVAETQELETPDVRTADFCYYRLRKPEYSTEGVKGIAAKVSARQGEGCDVFVYFKHEDTPQGALYAEQLLLAR